MLRLVLVKSVLIVLIPACAPTVPKPELHPMAHWVRESIDIKSTRETCRFLGIVTARDQSGSQALMKLRSQVALLDGNTFVIVYDHSYSGDRHRSLQAEAYLCSGDPMIRP
jgi:hypothetical protein